LRDDVVARWADLLTDYCLRVVPGETIAIGSEMGAWPLVEACYRALVLRGAHPLVRPEFPALTEFFLSHATDEQLAHVPPAALHEAEAIDASIRIAAEADVRAMTRADPRRQAVLDRARAPLRRAARGSRWVVTQYPTPAYAADAAMDQADYEAFVASAMFLDRHDPVAAWQGLGRRQAGLVEFMARVKTVRIEGAGTDLTLSVAGRSWVNSDGRRNMPSGEIFTGPVEDSPRGRFRCGFPVRHGGRTLTGVALTFEGGRVVSARADDGEEYLLSMLDLDPGARSLGEIGIGLNPRISRFTGSTLYDEKIGGTVHVALGQSYPETGGVNTSALHWDLIADTRSGGRVTADGRVVMEDGVWRVG
jgi:aminopeptidase